MIVIRLAVLIAISATFASPAFPIVIRHDANDVHYQALGQQARYQAVGRFELSLGGGNTKIATGNYIGRGRYDMAYVLTAAHVLWDEFGAGSKFVAGGQEYDVIPGSQRVMSKRPDRGRDRVIGKDDIGLVQIRPTPHLANLRPAKFWNAALSIPPGLNDRLTVTAVGFGKAGNGNVGEGDQDDLKRGMWNKLDGLNVRRGFSALAGYVSDFDKNDAEHNRLDSVDFPGGFAATQRSDRTWLKLEGSLASGDSGGGLFAELGGRDVIIGIASGVTSFAPIELFRYGSLLSLDSDRRKR